MSNSAYRARYDKAGGGGHLDALIATATRHVVEGRRIVEQQRQRVASGGFSGAEDLLETFETSLAIFEGDLERLLKQRDEQ